MFYDCEASGVHGVVIEIGWAFVDDTGKIVSEAYRLKPVDDWDIEAVWEEVAEVIHGLPLEQLRVNNKPVWEIVALMNQALAERELNSDSPFDETWVLQSSDFPGMEATFNLPRWSADHLVAPATAQRDYDLRRYRKVREVVFALRLTAPNLTHGPGQSFRMSW